MQINYIFRIFVILFFSVSVAEKYTYLSTEHPKVTYFDTKYTAYVNMTSRRYGRNDVFYYVGFHVNTLVTFSNNITIVFYFYEWLTNVYKPSFVVMHNKFCDFMEKDMFFGAAFRLGIAAQQTCPFPPGEYHFYNMTIPVKLIPPHFPFTKGRIYCNVTVTDTNEVIGSAYVDMEIKQINTKRNKKN